MILVAAGLVMVFGKFRFSSGQTYHATFAEASRLKSGQDVRIAGVPVGSDEPLAPPSDEGIPVLGSGWPAFPTSDAVAQAVAQGKPPAVWDMSLHTGRADNSTRIEDGKHRPPLISPPTCSSRSTPQT